MPKTPKKPSLPRRPPGASALTRRGLLRGLPGLGAAVTLGPGLPGCGSDGAMAGPLFGHGVASGDPVPDGVILWTRVSPAQAGPLTVTWQVSSDPDFQSMVQSGSAQTSAERDYTVKVDVRGLGPGRTYYYRFATDAGQSPIGRTRTAPTGAVGRARFGVASCASFSQGYFHAYRALARRADLDAVIHLGDYIYEYGPGEFGSDRPPDPPHETVTLGDYRRRHAQYKRDPDLQEVHRQHPFIVVWDDHESANNAWKDGAQNHQAATEGGWAERKAAAQRAYAEWMPIREQADPARIWRKLAWGDLADVILLDTRLWARGQSSAMIVGPTPMEEPGRTLLGDDQAAWMEQEIGGSAARWKLVAQQVMVANLLLAPGMLVNLDQWQGYPGSRQRLLEFLRGRAGSDVVVLTGDIHSSWANELVVDPNDPMQYEPDTGKGALAVELVTPGITSPGLPPEYNSVIATARPYNPHLRWFDLFRQGYLLLDVTPERVQGAWYLWTDITAPAAAPESFAAAWSVAAGSTRLVQDAEAAPGIEGAPPLAP